MTNTTAAAASSTSKIVRAGGHTLLKMLARVVGREHDNRCVFGFLIDTQRLAQGHSVELGHPNIQQDDIRIAGENLLQGILAVGRGDYLKIVNGESLFDQVSN